MTTDLSLWAQVATRYESPVELRAGALGARFETVFEAGLILIRKANGVERRVDFDEFRATWRLLATDGSNEMLGIASANAKYLRAIREDLLVNGVPPDAEAIAIDEDDVSTMERQLLDEVERFSRPAVDPLAATDVAEPGSSSSTDSTEARADDSRTDGSAGGEIEALRRQLVIERAEKETAVREAARLAAALSTTEGNLLKEQERAAALDRAATKRAQRSPTVAGIGSRPDISAGAIALAESTIAEIAEGSPELRKAAVTAVDLARRDPASAITKCRVIIEVLVKDEWRRVFKAEEPPKWKSFNDLARELDGQPGVDPAILNAERTLYRLANAGAHSIDGVSPRRAALVLLLTTSILAGRL